MIGIQAGRILVLFGFLVTTTACAIVSYGHEVIAPAVSVKKEGIIRFFYFTGVTRNPNAGETPLPMEAKLLQEILENEAGFAAAILLCAFILDTRGTALLQRKRGSTSFNMICLWTMS